jgi:hypothetical protein
MDADLVHPGILVPSFRKQNKNCTFEFLKFQKIISGIHIHASYIHANFWKKNHFFVLEKTNVDCI